MLVAEAFGVIINCIPSCMLCSLPCGCCWCFWTSLFGWNNIVGASLPSCCRRDACGLQAMFATSSGALVGRIVVAAGIAAFLHRMHEKEDEYDKCMDKLRGSDENTAEDNCDEHLVGSNRHNDDTLIGWLTFSLVVAMVYTTVSLVGMHYGWVGYRAEAEAKQNTQSGTAANAAEAGTGNFVMSAPQVVVVQARAIPAATAQQDGSATMSAPSAAGSVSATSAPSAAATAAPVHATLIQHAVSEKGSEISI